MDTPDENGYVADNYRITYLEAHIKAMRDAIYQDGVDLFGYTTLGLYRSGFSWHRGNE